jgi:AraC-like DNA-binding protein
MTPGASRIPGPALRPFVRRLWVSDENAPASVARERVLPAGGVYLVFRLTPDPLRVFDGAEDPVGHAVAHSVVGGLRTSCYLRDVSRPLRTVGAELHPAAAELLLGAPAELVAGRHTPLAELWGPPAHQARQRLLETEPPPRQLDLLESLLAVRLRGAAAASSGDHARRQAMVAWALGRFSARHPVGQVVRDSGLSHRRFIELFRRTVGLPPKLYCRILRFQRVLAEGALRPDASPVDLALACGYSDQAHFNREFRGFAGLSPGRYRALSPAWSHHLPVGAAGARVNFVQDGQPPGGQSGPWHELAKDAHPEPIPDRRARRPGQQPVVHQAPGRPEPRGR